VATTSPLIGAPIPEAGDDVEDLLEVDDAILHTEEYVVQRYTTAAARDTALPVPDRGMTAVIGTSAANSYPCWYDGTVWRGGRTEQPAQDGGYPVAAAAVTVETVLSRITVPARDYARTVTAVGAAYVIYTQANDVDLVIYAGASVAGRYRQRMQTSIGESLACVSSGGIAVAASASVVMELRVVRAAGTGSVSTSISAGLTSFQATVTPA